MKASGASVHGTSAYGGNMIWSWLFAALFFVCAGFNWKRHRRAKSDYDIATALYYSQLSKGCFLLALILVGGAMSAKNNSALGAAFLAALWYLFSARPLFVRARRRYPYPFAKEEPVDARPATSDESKSRRLRKRL